MTGLHSNCSDAAAAIAIAAWRSEARRHEVGNPGERVVWRTLGHGKPLVLLHGGHGNWLHWSRNLQALAKIRSLWLPDMPGYGDSDSTQESTLPQLLHRLSSSLDRLLGAGTPIDLIGFSFGALVSAHLAATRGSVDRMALLGPAGHGGIRRPKAELQNWRAAAATGDAAALQGIMRHNLLAHMLYDPESADALALRIHTDACRLTRFHSRPISRAGGLQTLLPHCGRRLLLAWGENDVTADPHALVASLSHLHRDARTALIPNAGHWVQFEASTVVDSLLGDWLESP